MAVTGKQLTYTVADLVAAHQLLRYVKRDSEEERLRIVAGITMAGLGFAYGPELEERLSSLEDKQLSSSMKRALMTSAGYAALGGVIGYLGGPAILPHLPKIEPARELEGIKEELDTATRQKPGGLLTIASAGWLGYSILFNDKTTKEEEHRQLWGIGAGALGYMYGPEAIGKIRAFVMPEQVRDDTVRVYARGGAILGAIAGGTLGWINGEKP